MAKEHWIWRCDRTIPSDTGAGRAVLCELLGQLQACCWPEHDVFDVHLATEEALVNAIKHGNRFAPDRCVRIRCHLADDLIRIEITDEGEGFDPSEIPNPTEPDRLESPGGRGVMLMKSFMSRVEYNTRGNRVVLEKARGKDADAPRNGDPAD
ncbi:MAG TPA: ATP-binding protein [Thermoguttaceae bacterium]|nr:ATP-binding protein [Thermoguttaceae bacterium]